MPQKIHQKIVNNFKGVDYSSNDIDRDFEYFKDSENVSLSYSAGIRGRKGARPLITGVGYFSVLKYESESVAGNGQEEIILCNGDLYRVSDFTFTITTANTISLRLDPTKLITKSTAGIDDNLTFPSMVLEVNSVDYLLSDISIGQLWDSLVYGGGHTLSYPSSSRTVSWARVNARSLQRSSIQLFDFTCSSLGTIQINDVITIPTSYSTDPKITPRPYESRLVQAVVTKIVNANQFTVRLADSLESKRFDGTYSNYVGGNWLWVGPPNVGASSIVSVDASAKTVTFKFPEPIPSVCHYKQLSSTARADVGAADHSFLGGKRIDRDINYSYANINECLFITHGEIPTTQYDHYNGLVLPYLDPKSTSYPTFKVGQIPASGSLYDSNSSFSDWGLGKYDGRRAYYAGAAPVKISAALTNTAGVGPGGIPYGTEWLYTGAVIPYYIDAKGRVIYGNPTYWQEKKYVSGGPDPWYVDMSIELVGDWFSVLGYGLGATAISTAAGTDSTLTVKVPHGVAPGDVLYYVAVKGTGAAVSKSTTIRTDLHETKSVTVKSVRGNTITLSSSITYGVDQRFVANQKMLIVRVKPGGASPNYYVIADLPLFESVYYDGYTTPTIPSSDTYVSFQDRIAESAMLELFDPGELGYDAVRTKSGSSIVAHAGRLFIGNGSSIYWSNPEGGRQSIEQTPPLNSTNVFGRHGFGITDIQSSGGSLYAFKKDLVASVSVDNIESGIVLSTIIVDGDYGASGCDSNIPIGGMLLCSGNGEVYVIKEGLVFDEIGTKIREAVRGLASDWSSSFSILKDEKQVLLLLTRPSINTVKSKQRKSFVLDLKKTETISENQADLVLTRSLFGGSWFKYSWDIGHPSGPFIEHKGTSYYPSFETVLTSIVDGTGYTAMDIQRSKYNCVSGLWMVWPDSDPNKYTDAGLPIRNMVNFTPIHKGSFDVDKIWSNLKFFRFLSNSDLARVTDWAANVELIYGLSNNILTDPDNVLKLSSNVSFANIQDTQSIVPLTGNRSPALEIRIVLEQLYKSMQFSTIILDYLEPFDVEGVEYTSED